MDLSTPDALERVVGPHLKMGVERTVDLELLHMLSASPDSFVGGSSSEEDDMSGSDSDTVSRALPTNRLARQASATPGMRPVANQPSKAKMPPAKPSKVVFAKPSADAATGEFVRQEVRPEPLAEVSELSKLMALQSETLERSEKLSRPAVSQGGKPINISVFGDAAVFGAAGSRRPIRMAVPEKAKMGQVVAMVLQSYAEESGDAPLDPDEHTLLMAESDGEPDEDLPDIPRDSPIGDFVVPRSAELCLALRRAAKKERGGAEGEASGATPSTARTDLIRVYLPQESHGQRLKERSIKHKLTDEETLADLMDAICRKEKVQLDPSKHVFKRALGDPVRPGEELETTLRLKELQLSGVHDQPVEPSIIIAPRTYADAPQLGDTRKMSREAIEDLDSHARRHLHTDVTAARYKEFQVVKVNKRGVRQERTLGIDGERFYNKTRGEEEFAPTLRDGLLKAVGVRSAGGGTKNPAFKISDMLDVQLGSSASGEPTRDVYAVFKDPDDLSKRKEYHYEAASAHEAAEIVDKLDHLLGMQGASQKTPRHPAFGEHHPAARSWNAPNRQQLFAQIQQRGVAVSTMSRSHVHHGSQI